MKKKNCYHILSLLLLIFFALGCAKQKRQLAPDQAPIDVVDPLSPEAPNGTGINVEEEVEYTSGASADFTPTSLAVMEEYVAERPLNNPDRFRVHLNLSDMGSNQFGGQVLISYYDNGSRYEGVFHSGENAHWAAFNNWMTYNGEDAFRGYFSDQYGAIVIVIDEFIDLGDGNGTEDLVGGSIYFKNFPPVRAPESPTKCWYVELGPYDCRTFFSDPLYPADGYKKLGDFIGLSRSKAFNEDF